MSQRNADLILWATFVICFLVVPLLSGCVGIPMQQMDAAQIRAAADAGIVCISSPGAGGVYLNTAKSVLPKDAEISVEPGAGCKTTIRTSSAPKSGTTTTTIMTTQPPTSITTTP